MQKTFLFLKTGLLLLIIAVSFNSNAQDAVGYQTPPKDIADLLLAKPTPAVSVDKKGEWMLLSERNSYPTVEELGQPEIRVAGLRLNPNNFSQSRQTYVNNFSLKNIKTNKQFTITGLPLNMLAGNVQWSDEQTKICFTSTTATKVDLYVIDVATHAAKKINRQALNIVNGAGIKWFDENTIM